MMSDMYKAMEAFGLRRVLNEAGFAALASPEAIGACVGACCDRALPPIRFHDTVHRRCAADLLSRILVINPEERATLEDIIRHPWLALYAATLLAENR